MNLNMCVLDKTFAVCKFSKEAMIPMWLLRAEFVSITRTDEELSIVCDQELIGDHIDELSGVEVFKPWKCLKVVGPLDFSLVGILSEISAFLASANVSIFAVSTFNTDYILVKSEMLDIAIEVLKKNGINIVL